MFGEFKFSTFENVSPKLIANKDFQSTSSRFRKHFEKLRCLLFEVFFIQYWWFNISSSISKDSRTRKMLRHATLFASKFRPSNTKIDLRTLAIVGSNVWDMANRKDNGTKMMIQWPDEGFFIWLAPASITINNHFHYCRLSLFNFPWFFRFLIFLPTLTFGPRETLVAI